jgi:hypothetical protein
MLTIIADSAKKLNEHVWSQVAMIAGDAPSLRSLPGA